MRIRRLAATLALAALPAAAMAPANAAAAEPVLPIGQIQGPVTDADDGATHRSPFTGSFVTTRGVVRQKIVSRTSAGQPNYGFFLQSTPGSADSDPLTSDGIFVFMSRFTTLIGGYTPQVGDEIVVRARVTEFFNLTELTSASLV
ncbi:MAG: lamin tail domain-containing protein, partial [Thermoleophilaceae bacterium]